MNFIALFSRIILLAGLLGTFASKIMANGPSRKEIAQEFASVILSLGQGITELNSPHISINAMPPLAGDHPFEYKLSYRWGNNVIAKIEYGLYGGSITNLWVWKEYRHRGLGRGLTTSALAHMKAQGATRAALTLGQWAHHTPTIAHQLYTSLGFTPDDNEEGEEAAGEYTLDLTSYQASLITSSQN